MKPNWKLQIRISGKYGHSIHRDDKLGVQMEKTWTYRENRFGEGRVSNVDTSWFIDNDPREFKSEQEMLEARKEANEHAKD